MNVLEIEDLGKRYLISQHDQSLSLKQYAQQIFNQDHERKKEFWAIRNISFCAEEGDVIGLVGANGSGKTTLLNIIAQVTEPTEGLIRHRGLVGALLGANTGFHPDLNAIDNIYLCSSIMGYSQKEIDQKLDEIIRFSELEGFIYQPIKHLSSGMQMKLAIAIVVTMKPEIFIFDEVISVIDEAFRKKVYEYFEKHIFRKRLAIVVNHDREYIAKTCNVIVELDHGRCKSVQRIGLSTSNKKSVVVSMFPGKVP